MNCLPSLFKSRHRAPTTDHPPPPYTASEDVSVVASKSLKCSPKVYHGRIVHSKSLKELEILPAAALGVDEHGTIQFVDSDVNSATEACEKHAGFKNAACIQLKPLQFLFPGMVDTHMHAPQYPNIAIGMEGTLDEWCANYTDPIEASYRDTSKAVRVYEQMVKNLLGNGSTTVAYNSSIHWEATNALADKCKVFGQRAIIGKMCILQNSTHDNWESSVEQSLEDEQKVIDYIRKIDPDETLLSPCVQPRAGSHGSPALFQGLGKLRDAHSKKLHVQAHMAETPTEYASMKKVHPGFETYADMYEGYGLLSDKTILAHCIHLTDRDIKVMAKANAGVAHNANSNTCLRDGECMVRQLLDAGIKVGLGTDCSAGYSISILDAMRQASNVSRHRVMHTGDESNRLSFEELVFLGTLGGAQVCALDHIIGNFLPGKKFDALMIDVGLEDNINVSGWEHDDLALVKKWVFMGDDRSIRMVWVGGNLVAGKDR